MVIISDVPMLSIGVTHERAGFPSTCTVQAPHSAMPQPNFVPVMPRTSRKTQSSGVSSSTSTLCVRPLTLILKPIATSPFAQHLASRSPDLVMRLGRRSVLRGDVDDGFGESLGGFLRQIVPDAAGNLPVLISPGEPLRVGSRFGMRRAVGVAF